MRWANELDSTRIDKSTIFIKKSDINVELQTHKNKKTPSKLIFKLRKINKIK